MILYLIIYLVQINSLLIEEFEAGKILDNLKGTKSYKK